MKLIIEIDEEHFNLLKMAVMNGMGDNTQKIVAQGIPLDKIRDEIEESITDYILDEEDTNTAIRMGDVMTKVFEIIDKYRAESEEQTE